jgi:recombination protein RecA
MTSLIDQAKRARSNISRFSSGSLSLDLALGGGWPRGRCCLVVGKESSGKSTTTLITAREISKIDWETGQFGGFTKVLYVDMENTFDFEWASNFGWDERHDVVCPESGEMASDIITEAIKSGEYGLIIGDSSDCFIPAKVDAKQLQDGGMPGARAQLLNRSYQTWTSALRNLDVPAHKLPTVLMINQYRLAFGVMYGDPRVIPGGEGQRFYSSIITTFNSPKIEDTKGVETAYIEISGNARKNKTAIPKRNFSFKVGLQDSEELACGEVNNQKAVMDLLKNTEIRKVKSTYTFLGEEYKTQKEISDRMKSEPAFMDKCWKLALQVAAKQGPVTEQKGDDENGDS